MKIKVFENIRNANDQIAAHSRKLLDDHGVFCINLMASPGAGKTSIIVQMIRKLKGKVRMGVIEGDLASSVDADTVAREDVPVLQINTGGGCHLNANQLGPAFKELPLADLDLVVVENVGNLVCTAGYDLGEHLKVLLASVPEGHDKAYKYPRMFDVVDTVVLNKTDLKPYIAFDTAEFHKAVKGVNEKVRVFEVSCTSGDGLDVWCDWLLETMGR